VGAGGVITPPPGYWARVQAICRKYDILLICDEVICGFGRTGEWFGADSFQIQPDIMCMAKGMSSGYLPISAVGVGTRVADVMRGRPGVFSHGFTYSGHPVAAAVALKNIDILDAEGVIDHVRNTVGPALGEKLGALRSHPLVGEVRGIGAMWAIELTADKATRAPFTPVGIGGDPRAQPVLRARSCDPRRARGAGSSRPPLISYAGRTIDELATILTSCLDTVASEL